MRLNTLTHHSGNPFSMPLPGSADVSSCASFSEISFEAALALAAFDSAVLAFTYN